MDKKEAVVPQFIADYIEYGKRQMFTLLGYLEPYSEFESSVDEIFEGDMRKCFRWCRRNSNLFACALINGYTVEKEKRYIVKMKNVLDSTKYLVVSEITGKWFFANYGMGNIIKKHTRKELEEAGFGDVFNSPLFEVEGVN